MISVCMATYNGEKYLAEQLKSILSQLADDDEVIISDDNSSDGTLSVIASLNDPRVKVYNHLTEDSKFKIDRVAHNFENALSHCHGDYIFFSDHDDVWKSNKVELMMNSLQKVDVVVSDCVVTDESLNVLYESYFGSIRKPRKTIIGNFCKSSFLGSCMAFRRCVMSKALPLPRYGVGHDLWIGIVGLKYFRVSFLYEPLIYYRRHAAVVTVGGTKSHTSLFFKIGYRFYLLKSILKLYLK